MSAPVRIPARRPPRPPLPGVSSSSASSSSSSSSSTTGSASYVNRRSFCFEGSYAAAKSYRTDSCGESSPLSESYRSPTAATFRTSEPEVGIAGIAEEGNGKGKEVKKHWGRRENLIGPALACQTHTVIDTGRPDGPPRLTSFVRVSQGFEWNPDIFLPTHSPLWGSGQGGGLERRREVPVDIVLSDEEVRDLLPQ